VADLLDRFATSTPLDPLTLATVREYVGWQTARRASPFTPDPGDDVEIRTYLLEKQIAGRSRKTIKQIISDLKQFYDWAKGDGLLASTPFEEFNFDRPLLSRDQIRRREDRLTGDPREREIARLRALNRLAHELNRTTDVQTMLDVTLATLVEVMGLQTAWIFLWTESGLTRYTAHAPAPHDFALCAECGLPSGLTDNNGYYLREPPDCHCQDLLRRGLLTRAVNVVECTRLQDAIDEDSDVSGLLFHATVPIVVQGQPLGIINVATNEWQFLSAADLQLLTAVGSQASAAIERAWLFARSAELGAMEERNRLAREIHDTLAQGLTAITLQLETAEALLDAANADRARKAIHQALTLTRANLEEARRSMLDLRATPLEGRALSSALAALADEWRDKGAMQIIFESNGGSRHLPLKIELSLYRIAHEALNNVARHAQAKLVRMWLEVATERVHLVVEDDGHGFDPNDTPKDRYGLIGMNERVKLLGGEMKLETSPGKGTRVEVSVPIVEGLLNEKRQTI
jgi:two-component system NarL family sensor kinase